MGRIHGYTAKHHELPLGGDRTWQHDESGEYVVLRRIKRDWRELRDKGYGYTLYHVPRESVEAMNTIGDLRYLRILADEYGTKREARKAAAQVLRDHPEGIHHLDTFGPTLNVLEFEYLDIRFIRHGGGVSHG